MFCRREYPLVNSVSLYALSPRVVAHTGYSCCTSGFHRPPSAPDHVPRPHGLQRFGSPAPWKHANGDVLVFGGLAFVRSSGGEPARPAAHIVGCREMTSHVP